MTDLAGPPLAAVKSVDEMLAIAHAMEREAAARYAMLADCMRRVDQREVADLLDELAAEERGHVGSVERLAQQTVHHAPQAAPSRAVLPKTFAREEEGRGRPAVRPSDASSPCARRNAPLPSGPMSRLIPPMRTCAIWRRRLPARS
jgi:lipopolysaccharide biosynthesis regulator YciM